MPGYKYAGKQPTRTHYYMPADDRELAAKFAYFREAESGINGGPAPIQADGECGTNGGYMKHYRRKEERCDPCKAAHTRVELRRQRKMAVMTGPNRRVIVSVITQFNSKIGSAGPKKTAPAVLPTLTSGA